MSRIDPDRIDLNRSLAESRVRIALPVLLKLIEMKGDRVGSLNAARLAKVAIDYADALLVEAFRKGES